MTVVEFELGLAKVSTPEALWALIIDFFKGSEIRRIVYHHVPPIGAPDGNRIAVAGHGVREDLLDRYVADRLYRHNPAFQLAMESVEPFYLDQVTAATPEQEAFLAGIRDFNLQAGLGVQVFGPNGRNGYCGLGFGPDVLRLEPHRVRQLQWVCQLAHLRYCAMLQEAAGPLPHLSARETEVLGWVARGKTNSSIGDILGISAHTVDAHLRRIYGKLGVFDRISAAIRGIGIGLIHAES